MKSKHILAIKHYQSIHCLVQIMKMTNNPQKYIKYENIRGGRKHKDIQGTQFNARDSLHQR